MPVIPVAGITPQQLTDTFGAARSGGRSHKGIDIFAREGTPVLAASSGTVIKAGQGGNLGGLRVWVRDDQGLFHYYAHMNAVDVKEGQRVEAGQHLGGVGRTGNAKNTPPHLHYSVNPAGHTSEHGAMNPYDYLMSEQGPQDPLLVRFGESEQARTTGRPDPQMTYDPDGAKTSEEIVRTLLQVESAAVRRQAASQGTQDKVTEMIGGTVTDRQEVEEVV